MTSKDSTFKFIICGTDTDIGKTLISSFFVRGLNSFYWKPIQSGIESQTDSQTVEKLALLSKEKIIKEAYVFTKPTISFSQFCSCSISNDITWYFRCYDIFNFGGIQ